MKETQNETINAKMVSFGKNMGATDIGFADISDLKDNTNLGYERAVSVIIRLSTGILKEIKNEPTITYFSHYRTLNRHIDMVTLRILLWLEERGYPSFAVPASQSLPSAKGIYTGIFQHKTAAVLSGKGFIGKSALFIHRDFGPAVRLGTVLTNAPFKTKKITPLSECGDCQICRKSCPAMAIEGNNWSPGMARNELFDAKSCSDHMKVAYQHIGRGVVCGLCIVNCPYYRKNL
ncbi:MAG: epoxyqueuosine reductase [Eubacterium sp.]